MASSRKPTYKVETKLLNERKRRNSELVIMWQCALDVTSLILHELWVTVLRIWDFLVSELWFSSSERYEVITWLDKFLPCAPEDFSDSWRDGRLLAILLNKLQPGCFPDAIRLDPDYGLRNVYKAFSVLETCFGITPNVLVEEIVTCSGDSDAKLFDILLQLKRLNEAEPEKEKAIIEPDLKVCNEQAPVSDSCIAKGTGLAVGFVGKISRFFIFCAIMSDLDVVIEIRGPNTVCSERITNRSPKKKRHVAPWEYSRPITRSISCVDKHCSLVSEEDDLEDKQIPLEYEIIGSQISLRYKPKETGKHQVTILWHGQHISDSPYTVSVEDPVKLGVTNNNVIHLKPALKSTTDTEKNEVRKISVRFQPSPKKFTEEKKKFGKILSKRILRYIVKINGKDVPVQAESTESLAAELLKMDYNIETCPSFHRRNSWGFAGDAERRKSMIRQFGVDVKELEAQVCQRRTRSLSSNSGSKRLMERSDSFDNLASRLKSVKEDAIECMENTNNDRNEYDYAFINEDLKSQFENAKDNDDAPDILDSEEGTEESKSLNDLTENYLEVNFPERTNSKLDIERISTLSINVSQECKVDNSYEDSFPNFPPNLNTNHLWKDEEINEEIINEKCSRSEIKLNESAYENKHSDLLKCLKSSTKKKRKKAKPKRIQNSRKVLYVYRKKNCLTRAARKEKQICKELSRNKNSYPEQFDANECMLELKHVLSTGISNNRKNEKKFSELENLNENKNLGQLTQYSKEVPNTHPITSCISTEEQSANLTAKRRSYAGANVGKVKSIENNPAFKNVIKSFKNNVSRETVKLAKEVDKDNNCLQNQCSIVKPPMPLIQSGRNSSDVNTGKTKPLRIHTLKTLKEFNFKQFDSHLGSTSPVKCRIKLWEQSSSKENQNISSKTEHTSETGEVSVKEKLAFWEKTAKTEQKSSKENCPEIRRNEMGNNECSDSSHFNSDITMNDLQDTASIPSFLGVNVKEQKETYLSINKETEETAKKQTNHKMSEELLLYPYKTRVRSFSDPGLLEMVKDKEADVSNSSNLDSSSKEFLYSSNATTDILQSDEESEEFVSDIIQSSGDEYIDDEIPKNAEEYWGDFIIPKGFKLEKYEENCSLWEEEFLQQQCLPVKSYPQACKVFGIAVYYGYVAIKNRFQVFTCGAGFGNLSVSVQGFGQHDVTLVTVAYDRNDVYEVTYQVMTAGYYLILIRWMDKAIPGSPFICKVTF